MLEIIDNIGYMKLMDGTSLLAHKKSTEQKIEDNKKTGHVFSNEESEMFFKNGKNTSHISGWLIKGEALRKKFISVCRLCSDLSKEL